MPTFRYILDGKWYKGNTHIHSLASDGGKSFEELASMYSVAGYDFLFRTDHWVASDVSADEGSYSLVWLDGVELDGKDGSGSNYHVVALGSFKNLQASMTFEQAMLAAREHGCLLILAHPQWMGNTFDEAVRWQFDGVEIYNHVCDWLNGKGNGAAYWNAVLTKYPNTLGLAVDDAHLKPQDPSWNGGWVVVNAPDKSPGSILKSLRSGNYYSSCGPVIESITYDGDMVHLTCSPVNYARLVGRAWQGKRIGAFAGERLSEVAFQIPDDWPYAYLEIEDSYGRRAWTNPLFIQE